jgi:hypothetical protein
MYICIVRLGSIVSTDLHIMDVPRSKYAVKVSKYGPLGRRYLTSEPRLPNQPWVY